MTVNPYMPPDMPTDSGRDRVLSDQPASTLYRGIRSHLPNILISLLMLTFVCFTGLLLVSSARDRAGGLLFLFNVPFMVAWALSAWLRWRLCVVIGIGVAVVQMIIATVMIRQGMGDIGLIVTINASIALPAVILALWSWERICPYEPTNIRPN